MMRTSRIRGCRSGTGSADAAGTTGGTVHRAARLGAPLPGAARWCPGGPARTRMVIAARAAATKQPDTTRTAGTSQHRAATVSGARWADTSPSAVPAARRGGRYPEAGAPAGRPARAAATDARGAVATDYDTGPGAALYDTGPGAAADLTATQVHADPDLADSDVFPRVRADIPRPASKAGKQRNQPKSRGKASRKHDDDENDWPSTEWDKLSDVEYWAELSADKPLATTARTAQPSAAAKPAADTARAARPASGRPAAPPAPVDYPGRHGGRRPAWPSAASHRPARPQSTRPPAGREPGPQRPAGQPASAQRTDPRAGDPAERLAARREQPDVTERIPVRDRQRRPATPPPYADDDPLTSPSFSRASAPAEDSRSYRAAGRERPAAATAAPRRVAIRGRRAAAAIPAARPSRTATPPRPVTAGTTRPCPPPLATQTPATGPTPSASAPTRTAGGPPPASPPGIAGAGPNPPRQQRPATRTAASWTAPRRPAPASPGPAGSAPASTGPHYPPAQPPASERPATPDTGPAHLPRTQTPTGHPPVGTRQPGPARTGAPAGTPPRPLPPRSRPVSTRIRARRVATRVVTVTLPSPARPSYGSTYGNGPDGGRYTGGHRSHPYRPDEYGGYHPRQG